MQSKFYNKFEVFENGDIYFVEDGYKKKLKQYFVSRNRMYRCVYVKENGKQKGYYVHRLVAQAFIPNPENKPQVNHIDGNPSNNRLDNLEWVTESENIVHAYEKIIPKYSCIVCGNYTFAKSKICTTCHCRNKEKMASETKRKNRIDRLKDSVDISVLNNREKKYYEMYLSGMSQSDIAKTCGLTKQAVSLHFISMKKKSSNKQ